jgi:hypothetical protein
MRWGPLSAEDAAERAQFLRFGFFLGGATLVMLTALAYFLVEQQRISGKAGLLLGLLNLPITVAVVVAAWHLTGGAARGLAGMMYGAGNLPPERQHSAEESLVARGFYAEARAAFEAVLAQDPEDNGARIKLGTLCREHLEDPVGAERHYLEVRRHHPTPREEAMVGHLLISLYGQTGQRGREMAELARFAERHRGTRAGEDAARRLKELKQELS